MITNNILHSCHKEGFGKADVFSAYKVFFGTLVSDSRLKIVNLLRNNKKNVTQIMSELGMDQTAVSHDLSRLKKCGFVKAEVDGKFREYSINDKTIKPLMNLIDDHMSEFCIHILRDNQGVLKMNDENKEKELN